MKQIISHTTQPVEMTRVEFRAILDRLESEDTDLSTLIVEHKAAHA